MKKSIRKIFSLFLALVMVFSLLPAQALAEEPEGSIAPVEDPAEPGESSVFRRQPESGSSTQATYEFTTQPNNGTVKPGETTLISWSTNFTPKKVEIVRYTGYGTYDVVVTINSGLNTSMSYDYPYDETYQAVTQQEYTIADFGYGVWAYYSNTEKVMSDDFHIAISFGEFIIQPGGGSIDPGGSLRLSWQTDFKPEKVKIQYNCHRGWITCVEIPQSEANMYSMSYTLSYSQAVSGKWRVLAYYGTGNSDYVSSSIFTITCTGYSFTQSPTGGTVVPDDSLTLHWATDFTPIKIEIGTMPEDNPYNPATFTPRLTLTSGLSAQMSRSLSYSQLYSPFSQTETWYVAAWYSENKVEYSSPFTISSTPRAFVLSPEGGTVPVEGTLPIRWQTNFNPVKVLVGYTVENIFTHSRTFVTLAELTTGLQRSMSHTLTYADALNLSSYEIRAYYSSDEDAYVSSETFTITGEPRSFTVQPEGGTIPVDGGLPISWETNFTPVKVLIGYTTENIYTHSQSFEELAELTTELQKRMSYTLTYADVASLSFFETLSTFEIRAYFNSGEDSYVSSEKFTITKGQRSYCGDGVSWQLADGVLTIRGSGSMWDFDQENGDYPGYYPLRDSITDLVIEEGVTRIGEYAFTGLTHVEEVTIPLSVTRISEAAFNYCDALDTVYYGGTEDDWDAIVIEDYNEPLQNARFVFTYSGTCGSGLTWVLSHGVLTISGSGAMTNWSYSSSAPWYNNRSSIRSVVIEPGVTSIGSYAFYACGVLETVSIPNGVTSIGDSAFYNCSSLTGITIPASVASIETGTGTFMGCSSLTAINVSASNANYASSDGILFNKSMDQLLACPGGKSGSYIIPDTVVSIAEEAFCRCGKLTGITIGSRVQLINAEAFNSCTALTSVTIPASVTALNTRAFAYCPNLKTITFLGNCPTISSSVFNEVTATAYYPGGNNTWTADKLQNYGGSITWVQYGIVAYGECGAQGDNLLWELTASGKLRIYGTGDMADWNSESTVPWYSNRSSIRSVLIEAGATSIGSYAFHSCAAMKTVSIPDGLAVIGNRAFFNCSALTDITIPASVTSIGTNLTFAGCSSLTSISVAAANANYSSVNGVLFNKSKNQLHVCPAGKSGSFTIPETVLRIDAYAFYECTKLTSITIGPRVQNIYNEAFLRCTGLTSITIPASVTALNIRAFAYCSKLKTITFLGNCPTISPSVFNEVTATAYYPVGNSTWTADKLLNYGGSITWLASGSTPSGQCGDNVFWGLADGVLTISGTGAMWDYPDDDPEYYEYSEDIRSVVIESGVTVIGSSSLYDLPNMSAVSIPDTVSNIGASAFFSCSSLSGVKIPGSVINISRSAFQNCSSLTEITIPASVGTIGAYAFWNSGLREITFLGSAPDFGDLVFRDPTLTAYYPGNDQSWTEDVRQDYGGTVTWVAVYPSGQCGDNVLWTLADGVLTISGTGEMWNWSGSTMPWRRYRSSIDTIVIESGVTTVGNSAFSDCTELTSVSLPDTLTSIGSSAFSNCTELGDIWLPDALTGIGDRAFYHCSSLWRIDIPANVSSIGINYVFAGCSGLMGIVVDPDNTKYASQDGVLFNKDMTSLIACPGGKYGRYTIPDTVVTVSLLAFYQCEYLTEVRVGPNVKLISTDAFSQCTRLSSVDFRGSVAIINLRAFDGCSNLTEIIFQGNAPARIDSTAFTGVTATAYYPPNNDTWTTDKMQDYGGDLTWEPYVERYDLWVGDTRVTGANMDNILGDDTATFDPETNTLTFTVSEPNITGLHETALIYAENMDLSIQAPDSGLELHNSGGRGVLVIEGRLRIDGDVKIETLDFALLATYAVTVNGNADVTTGIEGYPVASDDGYITITGDLTAQTASYYVAFAYRGSINIGGNVNATNTRVNGQGLSTSGGDISIGGDVRIESYSCALTSLSGSVTIHGSADLTTGRGGEAVNCFYGDITIVGDLTAQTAYSKVVSAVFEGNINIGGNVNATSTNERGTGLDADSISIGGDATVRAGTALYADSGSVTINGNADLTAASDSAIYCLDGDITIIGGLKAQSEGYYSVYASTGNISIGGNVSITNTRSYSKGLFAEAGTVTMSSGVWDIAVDGTAIWAKSGILIPETHSITTPAGGKIVQRTSSVYGTYYTVTEADGATEANHVVIKPRTLGDINMDGVVNALDLLVLRKYLVELPVEGTFDETAADLNGDGTIDILDLVRFRKTFVT